MEVRVLFPALLYLLIHKRLRSTRSQDHRTSLPSPIAQWGQNGDNIAFASGLPVVSTPVGGVPDIVDDGRNGILSANTTPNEIGLSIQRLMDDDGLRIRLIKSARQFAEKNLSWKVQVNNYIRFYSNILSN